ncbi:unnamed protein product [Ilex paraguariensis]|uniref:Pyruvate kinase C-terminal domain-containing protein n=1 Tax=Ilex paraguariensis TaxID=185542 RepID=A0ABC8SA06_9AQUA
MFRTSCLEQMITHFPECAVFLEQKTFTITFRIIIGYRYCHELKCCLQAEKVYNQDLYFKRAVKYVGEPMTYLEAITSSAVRAAIKVKASVIICFTSSGRAARLIAKYRPTMPVISVVIPQIKSNQIRWTVSGAFQGQGKGGGGRFGRRNLLST